MRIDLNLARQPFRNRSIFWIVMGAAFLVAGATLLAVLARMATVGADTASMRDKVEKQERTIGDLEARLAELKREKGLAVFSDLDRKQLDEARLIINQRSFSWTRLLGDLERTMPGATRVTSIDVVSMEGEGAGRVITLSLSGKAHDFNQLTALLASFDKSGGRFTAEPVVNGPSDDASEYEFTVLLSYRPDIAVPEPVETAAAAEETANG